MYIIDTIMLRFRFGVLAFLLFIPFLGSFNNVFAFDDNIRIVSGDGKGNVSNSDATYSAISPDGRYAAFASSATNLTKLKNTCNCDQIYVKDLTSNALTPVTISVDGKSLGDAQSLSPSFSEDGRYITFQSMASNLLDKKISPIGTIHIYLRDLRPDSGTPSTKLISVTPEGKPANQWSIRPFISYDGKSIAFTSWATNMVNPKLPKGMEEQAFIAKINNWNDVPSITLLSVGTEGYPTNARTIPEFISPDGNYVGVYSLATDIVKPSPPGNIFESYICDVNKKTITPIILNSNLDYPNGDTFAKSISADNKFVSIESRASNLVNLDGIDTYSQVYLKNLQTNKYKIISKNVAGTKFGNSNSQNAFISGNGNFLTFDSTATNLITGIKLKGGSMIYKINLTTSKVNLITKSNKTTSWDGSASSPSFSTLGDKIVFLGKETNIQLNQEAYLFVSPLN